MSQQDLLKRVVDTLDRSGIDYMVTGAVASSLQGEPRSTHDLDLVVALEERHVKDLLAAFPGPRFYLDEEAVREAIRTGGLFNLMDVGEGDKVDFWLLTDEPFDQSRFARKYVEEVLGIRLKVSSPEDTILQKLKWAKMTGGGEKYYRDALGVYEVQVGTLDLSYLADWAQQLGVEDLWRRLQREAEEA